MDAPRPWRSAARSASFCAPGASACCPPNSAFPPARAAARPACDARRSAQLAGISTTWYTWLEQGRDVSVSPHGLARIAAALRLDPAARAYLFELAGRRDPAPEPDPDALPPSLPACLAAIATPAYVLDRPWNFRVWNDAAAESVRRLP